MYKFALIITILTLLACGKKNATTNKVALVGNGRNSGTVDQLLYSTDDGLPKYLISDYQFAKAQTVPIDSAAATTPATAPVTSNVAYYIQVRVALTKPPKDTTATTTTVAKISGPKNPPPPQKAPKRNYEYFYEEIVTCTNGDLSKASIIGHADLPGEGTLSKTSPLQIPKGGSLAIIQTPSKTKAPVTYASLQLEKTVGSASKINLTLRHSTLSKEVLATEHSKYPNFTDQGINKIIQDVAKSCVGITGAPPATVKPGDVQEATPNLVNDLEFNTESPIDDQETPNIKNG